MKIFVCVKQVPDTEAKIKLKADASGIDTAGIKWVMNPYDEYAVEEAVKARETGAFTIEWIDSRQLLAANGQSAGRSLQAFTQSLSPSP